MSHVVVSLILALLSFCSFLALAQDGDLGYETYGTYGGGDNNTTAPAPMPPPAQPTPPPTPGGGNTTRPTQTGSNEMGPNQPARPPDVGSAAAALPITLSNNNSWTHAETGDAFEQNNYLIQNTGNRPTCDVSIKAPLANSNSTRIYSSYNVEVQNTTAREISTCPSTCTRFGPASSSRSGLFCVRAAATGRRRAGWQT